MKTAAYSSSFAAISDEHLPYVDRPGDSARVISLMRARRRKRKLDLRKRGADKSRNRLIAVPGCPGIGKSTFLAHFPESVAFSEYINDIKASPIIASLSFNSVMGGGGTSFGLRILFGAAACMVNSKVSSDFPLWNDFFDDFEDYGDLNATQAIYILREVYGRDRYVLLVVDEISKANSIENPHHDKLVMSQIGVVLDSDGNTDVVVSSLSPKYIVDLLSGSNRKIDYCVLLPLLDSHLVQKECQIWAREKMKLSTSRNDFLRRVLESTYILASGHPRTLEFMSEAMDITDTSVACWNNVDEELVQHSVGPMTMIQLLGGVVESFLKLSSIDVLTSFEMALSWSAIIPTEKNDFAFRELLENGSLFLIVDPKYPASDEFLCAMRISSFLKHINDFPIDNTWKFIGDRRSDTAVKAAVLLFGNEFDIFPLRDRNSDISVLWERAVALTIVTRSISGKKGFNIMGPQVGLLKSTQTSHLTVRLATKERYMRSIGNEELVMSPDNYRGFDGVVSSFGRMIYFNAKIGESSTKTSADSFSSATGYTLQSHLWLYPGIPLSSFSMVFYAWIELTQAGNAELIIEIRENLKDWIHDQDKAYKSTFSYLKMQEPLLTEVELKAKTDDFVLKMKSFVDDHCNINIHVMDKAALSVWLLPTMTPIPRLVESVSSGSVMLHM